MSEDSRNGDQSRLADAVFEALADESRRLSLYYLHQRESATVEELATVVSGWTRARQADPEMVTPEDRDRAKLRLHHVALPKLDSRGFVSYDPAAGDVAFADAPELLEAVLDHSLARERLTGRPESVAGDERARGDEGGRDEDESRGTCE